MLSRTNKPVMLSVIILSVVMLSVMALIKLPLIWLSRTYKLAELLTAILIDNINKLFKYLEAFMITF